VIAQVVGVIKSPATTMLLRRFPAFPSPNIQRSGKLKSWTRLTKAGVQGAKVIPLRFSISISNLYSFFSAFIEGGDLGTLDKKGPFPFLLAPFWDSVIPSQQPHEHRIQ
jgi:hypothetical protein